MMPVSTETSEKVDTYNEEMLDHLKGGVPCAVEHNGISCTREAKWRIYWKTFPCGHQPKPGHACNECKEMLLNVPVWVRCRIMECRQKHLNIGQLNRAEPL